MEIIDSKSIRKLKDARDTIDLLQDRLFKCEQMLDDLARGVEIAMESKQYYLSLGFIQDAREMLEDRLCLPEVEAIDQPIKIIEDDRETANSKST